MFKRIALLPSLAALLLVILTVNLGAWQLRRADEKRQLQLQREAFQQEAPRAWEPLSAGVELPAALLGRSAQLRGEFLPEKTVYLDNRSRQGVAGLHVLTPLRLAGSTEHVLVLRGWVARTSGHHAQLPKVHTPSGTQQLSGMILADLGRAPYFAAGVSNKLGAAWAHLDLAQYRLVSGLSLQPLVLRQFSPSDDGLLRDWPVPANEVDKHLGYAFQWFALALTVFGLWLYFSVIKPNSST